MEKKGNFPMTPPLKSSLSRRLLIIIAGVLVLLAALVGAWFSSEHPPGISLRQVSSGTVTNMASMQTQTLTEANRNTFLALYNEAEKERVEGIPVENGLELMLLQGNKLRATFFYQTAGREIYVMRQNQFFSGVVNYRVRSEELADFLDRLLAEFTPDRI